MTSPNLDTSAEQEAGDTASLKNRRRSATKKRPASTSVTPPSEEKLPPLPDRHPTMANALQRRAMTLGHPAEKHQPIVAETGGHVPSSRLSDYIASAFDASEQLRPPGCRTPITRSLWSKGQHVRRDVYNTYLAEHPELAESGVVDVQLPDGEDQDSGSGDGGDGADGEDDDGQSEAANSGEAPTDTDPTM